MSNRTTLLDTPRFRRRTEIDTDFARALAAWLSSHVHPPSSARDLRRRRQEHLDALVAVALWDPRLGVKLARGHEVTGRDFRGERDAEKCFEAALAVGVNAPASMTVDSMREVAVQLAARLVDRIARRLKPDDVALLAEHGSPHGEITVRWTAARPPNAFSLRSPTERFAEAIEESRRIADLLDEIRQHEVAARRHQQVARELIWRAA